jgi:hypothetical protein
MRLLAGLGNRVFSVFWHPFRLTEAPAFDHDAIYVHGEVTVDPLVIAQISLAGHQGALLPIPMNYVVVVSFAALPGVLAVGKYFDLTCTY